MYRLSRLRYVFPLGLLAAFFLDGSLSKLCADLFFKYPYAMSSQLVMLWLVFTYFFKEDIDVPLMGAAVIVGILADVYYAGILGLFMFLYPAVIMMTRSLGKLLDRTFLSMILIFFIDLTVFEALNYFAYSAIGIIHVDFGDFLVYNLAPTLALNLIYFVVLYWPIGRLFRWSLSGRR
ncbi:rod shape-determining protein MreD [Limosilactobacillus difficilis]|uniref:rod shape-determining protein MreD n=1 Tax=Limosilactobacillus difficilis TaxID=2991838 RepID=UPI0024BB8F43|nr:rod shape-determining protein MreD [Limosilactobacillus difficilis]